MSDPTEQQPYRASGSPFAGAEFVENPEPRCACVLIVDTSASMQGDPIRQLTAGIASFKDELVADTLAAKRVEIAVVGFGSVVQILSHFSTPDRFVPPELEASGETFMGTAILQAIDLLAERKATFNEHGLAYYRPWIFLITDGEPTDDWSVAALRVAEGEERRQFQFFAVGVEGANMEKLSRIARRQPLQLKGLRFRDLFEWLSRSLQSVSRSQTGDSVPLENPATPSGWAVVG